jgi:hypothetical protein
VYGVAVWSGILGVPVSVISSSWVSGVLSVMFCSDQKNSGDAAIGSNGGIGWF